MIEDIRKDEPKDIPVKLYQSDIINDYEKSAKIFSDRLMAYNMCAYDKASVRAVAQ